MLRKPLPSLNAIRAFETVSRHLNYKIAAAELNVTPSAVKQLVTKLEHYVGEALVIRQGKTLTLTPAAKRSIPLLSEGFAQLHAGVKAIGSRNNQNQLILSVETSFASTWLVPKLEQFRAIHPEISVLLDSTQKIVNLEDDTVDIAIRYGVDSPAHYNQHFLFDDHVIPACSPTLLSNGVSNLEDLLQLHPMIHWDMSAHPWAENSRELFSWANWNSDVHPNTTKPAGLSFNDYGQAVQAAIAGQGILLASRPLLSDHFEQSLLSAIGQNEKQTNLCFELVTQSTSKPRPQIDAFVSWITGITGEDTAP